MRSIFSPAFKSRGLRKPKDFKSAFASSHTSIVRFPFLLRNWLLRKFVSARELRLMKFTDVSLLRPGAGKSFEGSIEWSRGQSVTVSDTRIRAIRLNVSWVIIWRFLNSDISKCRLIAVSCLSITENMIVKSAFLCMWYDTFTWVWWLETCRSKSLNATRGLTAGFGTQHLSLNFWKCHKTILVDFHLFVPIKQTN